MAAVTARPATTSWAASSHWLRKLCLLARSNAGQHQPGAEQQAARRARHPRSTSAYAAATSSSTAAVCSGPGTHCQTDSESVRAGRSTKNSTTQCQNRPGFHRKNGSVTAAAPAAAPSARRGPNAGHSAHSGSSSTTCCLVHSATAKQAAAHHGRRTASSTPAAASAPNTIDSFQACCTS